MMPARLTLLAFAVAVAPNSGMATAESSAREARAATSLPIPGTRCHATLPAGWVTTSAGVDLLEFVHDGPEIDRITVRWRRPWLVANGSGRVPRNVDELYVYAEKLLSKFAIAGDGTPPEVRRIGIRSDTAVPMFDIELRYWTDGVEFGHRIGGWITEGWLITIEYRAPTLVYFDRDLPTYDRVLVTACAPGAR
ncbi:MAG: hypothetical protein JSR73_08070 [Proteobacteria bacterium]|nr:hypothetical protein [Pseudomonadota bacterium]